MATEVVVPSFGLGWNSGRIAHWYTADGASVSAGNPVACIESDHVAFEVEADADGIVRHYGSDAQRTAGGVLAIILAPGERLPEGFDPAARPEFEAAFAPEPEASATWDAPQGNAAEAPSWESRIHDEPEAADDFDFASALPTAEQEAQDADFEAQVLPLRRQTLPGAPPVDDDESPWAPVVGDDLRVSDEWSFAANEVEPGEPPVKAPEEDPSDYFDVAPFAPGVTRAEDIEPSSDAVDEEVGGFASAPQPTTVSGAAQYMRVRADLREVHKMRGQLAREWHGLEPHDEDVLVRAAARVLAEAGMGDSVALVVPEREGERSSVLSDAAATPFRTAVEALAAGWEAPFEGPHAFEVISFGEWGLDEAVPELRDGRPFALSVGAVRKWAIVDGDALVAAPVATLTLAYDPGVVSAGEAAWFLARVRELLEAPYALLAA